jgi:carbohydrate esterase-like sialic acid-specific acetylesterase
VIVAGVACAALVAGCGGKEARVLVLAGQSNMLGAESSVVRTLGSDVDVVQCAKSGSRMAEWTPPHGELYRACVDRVRGRHLVSVLFFQGESDAERRETALRWRAGFAQLVAGFRRVSARPSLPVVFAVIGRTDNPARFRAWETVKRAQRSVRLPCVARIETDDLAASDEVHFTRSAYAEIARRFERALRRLQAGSCTGG